MRYIKHCSGLVLFWSGARKSKILALRYCDVDFENKEIEINNSWNDTDSRNRTIKRIGTIPN